MSWPQAIVEIVRIVGGVLIVVALLRTRPALTFPISKSAKRFTAPRGLSACAKR